MIERAVKKYKNKLRKIKLLITRGHLMYNITIYLICNYSN
jgi:hypothetical protein